MTIVRKDDLDKALQMLRDEADAVICGPSLSRPWPGPDLRSVAFIPYLLEPGHPNLSGIALIPVIDGSESEGLLGIEIVSPDNRIIRQTTVPLSSIKSYCPARLTFPPIPDSHRGVFELRVFTRNARHSVRVLESRFLPPLRGLRRWRTPAVCGLILGAISPASLQDGVWCVLDFPKSSVLHVEQGVLSLRGWAWSRESGAGRLFVEIESTAEIKRWPVRHRYCRFDVSQVIPEIPPANYAGFEVSLDRFDLPEQSSVTLVFETSAGAYRASPIQVTRAHDERIAAPQNLACDCCRGTNLTDVGRKDGLTIRRCQDCGLVFTTPRPDFSRIRQRYSETYFEQEYLPLIHSTLEGLRQHWNNILDIVECYKNISPYLFDVGTGAGYSLQEATRRGWIASGIDVNPAAARYARGLGLDVSEGDILSIELPPDKFGAVLLESTIEHLLSPRQALAKCAQSLHPGGGIVIGTISNEGDMFMTQGMDFSYVGPSEHLYYFPASALCRLCESVGLRVERLWRDPTGDSVALVATKCIDRWD